MEALAVLFVLFMAAICFLAFVIGGAGLTLWASVSAWLGIRRKTATKRYWQQQAQLHTQAIHDYRRPYDAHRSAENLAYWQQRLEQERMTAN